MSDAQLERTNVKIQANNHDDFHGIWRSVAFEGFLKVYLRVMMTMKKNKKECCLQ
jgi:DNA topoisomerase-1